MMIMMMINEDYFTGNPNRGLFRRFSGSAGQHFSISFEGRMSLLNASTMVFLSSRTTSVRSSTFLLISSANCITFTLADEW